LLLFVLTACTSHQNLPIINSEECASMNGKIVNTLDEIDKCSSKDILGEVMGLDCPCICCKI